MLQLLQLCDTLTFINCNTEIRYGKRFQEGVTDVTVNIEHI